MNQGLGEEYEVPVPWYLVEHPGGLVVIDGGNAAECADASRAHWGQICDVYWPEMTREQACVPALQAAGFDPADVRFVLQSHLHLDHTGALGAIDQFPNAEVIATRSEYEYAFAPDWFAAGGYIQADYNNPGVPWALLEDTEDATTCSATARSAAGGRRGTPPATSRSKSPCPTPGHAADRRRRVHD